MPKKGASRGLDKAKKVSSTSRLLTAEESAREENINQRIVLLQDNGCPDDQITLLCSISSDKVEEPLSRLERLYPGKNPIATVAPTGQASGGTVAPTGQASSGTFVPPDLSALLADPNTTVSVTMLKRPAGRPRNNGGAAARWKGKAAAGGKGKAAAAKGKRGKGKKGSDESESDEEEGEAPVESEGEGDGHDEDDDQEQHDDENPAPPPSYTKAMVPMDVEFNIQKLFYHDLKSRFDHRILIREFNVMLFLRTIEELRESAALGTFLYPNAMASLAPILAMTVHEQEAKMWGGNTDATALAALYLFSKNKREIKEPDGSVLSTMMPILDDICSLVKLAEDISAKDERASARTAVQFNPALAGPGPSKRRSKAAKGAPAASTCPFRDISDLSPEEQRLRADKFVSFGYDPNGTDNVFVDCFVQNNAARWTPPA